MWYSLVTPQRVFGVLVLILLVLFFRSIEVPLLGAHSWRQADTNFIAYSFCKEDANIMYPRVPIRGETSGIAIGEFPLFSWINAVPCRVTGNWSEVFPRLMTLFYFLLSAWVWMRVFQIRNSQIEKNNWGFLVLYLFACLNFVFLTRTLPDGLALLLAGFAGLLWAKNRSLTGAIVFLFCFLIRPYLAGLMFLLAPQTKQRIQSGILMIAGYFFWFRYWKTKSEVANFNVRLKPIEELLSDAPTALGDLLPHLLKWQFNWIGLVLLVLGFALYKRQIWIWVASVGLLLLTSGMHYTNHQYYMLGSSVIVVWFMALGLPKLKKYQASFLLVFGLVAIFSRGNEFHFPKHRDWETVPRLIEAVKVPPEARITAANGIDPNWLYYAKRTGYAIGLPSIRTREDMCLGSSVVSIYDTSEGPQLIDCRNSP